MAQSLLACSACFRRTVQLIPQQRIALERRIVQQALLTPSFSPSPRWFATEAPATTEASALTASTPTASAPATSEPLVTTTDRGRKAVEDADGDTQGGKDSKQKLQRRVKWQLSKTDDPYHIAKSVDQLLAKDRYEEALLLTQTASKRHQMVVAWNHLIAHQFEKQRLRLALKTLNDMKKRAQLPNAQTYTILFRGCATYEHPKIAVAEAIKHYNNLLRDSRLEPNSTHMNAVINVCGRAGDLDSMFSILDSVNDTTRAPTAFTYATILQALRYTALSEVKDLDEEDTNANLSKMVYRSKALWEEVIQKWHKGRLVIDEPLVCAMGRVLLMSPNRQEKKEVLDLLEQTMGLPNLSRSDEASESPETQSTAVASSKMGLHATPGRNTLSLVLSALSSARMATSGIKYWNLLVREHGVVPDNDNWLRMLGMLKVAKASSYSADIIRLVPDEHVNPLYFRIAMEACVRDNINPNVIRNADRVLDAMVARLKVPDPHAMRLYLRVALVSHYDLRVRAKNGDDVEARRLYGNRICDALARLWEPYQKLHTFHFQTFQPKDEQKKRINYNDKREVIALARIMYSSFQKVIEERMLPEEDLARLRPVGARINREIQRFFSNRETLEPNLNPKAKAKADMSEYEYRPAGDFIWDTTAKNEPVSERAERRRGEQRPGPDSDFGSGSGSGSRRGLTGEDDYRGVSQMDRASRDSRRDSWRDSKPESGSRRGLAGEDGYRGTSRMGRDSRGFQKDNRRDQFGSWPDRRPRASRWGSQKDNERDNERDEFAARR